MKTINEIYEIIKQKCDDIKIELNKIYGKANDFLKDYDFKSGVDVFMKNNQLVGEVNAYKDIVTLIEESGVLEEDKELVNYKQALELACKEFENFIYIRDQEWLTKPECLLAKASEKIKGDKE